MKKDQSKTINQNAVHIPLAILNIDGLDIEKSSK